MNIVVPDQDGLETIMALRREFPESRIIAMMGANDTIGILNFVDVAKTFGAKRTLQEPLELQALLNAVAADVMT